MRLSARRGYTLLELMIVMVILAIIGRFAIPKIGISGYRSDAAMRVVQSTLQQAHRSAIQRQTDVMVSFDTINERVRTLNDINNNHIVDAGEEVRWRPLEEGNRFDRPSTGVNGTISGSISGANLSTSADGYPTVYYRRDGASSTGYELYLRSSSAKTSDFRALIVTQATGRVETFRYDGSVWRKAGI